MINLPPKPVFWATARITILAWFVLRLLAGFSYGSPSILPSMSLLFMLGVAAVAVIDVTVARERVLLGNLGVGRRVIVGISLLVSGTLEIVAGVLVDLLVPGG